MVVDAGDWKIEGCLLSASCRTSVRHTRASVGHTATSVGNLRARVGHTHPSVRHTIHVLTLYMCTQEESVMVVDAGDWKIEGCLLSASCRGMFGADILVANNRCMVFGVRVWSLGLMV